MSDNREKILQELGNVTKFPDDISIEFLNELQKKIQDCKQEVKLDTKKGVDRLTNKNVTELVNQQNQQNQIAPEPELLQNKVTKKSVTFDNGSEQIVEVQQAEQIAQTVETTQTSFATLFGFNIPSQTLYLAIVLLILIVACYFFTSPKEVKKPKKGKKDEE